LKADPFCFEAFEHLVDNHMLTNEQEAELLASLNFDPEDHWLSLLYSCRANKYGQGAIIDIKIAELEQESEYALQQQAEDEVKVGGYCLKDNTDVMACRADLEYHRGDFQRCYESTKALLEKDPYHLWSMPLHLGAALELGKKNELFLRAHSLVQEYPNKAVSWFAVGCYYYCIRQYDHARR
jgi:anaphase-promoting complex subunit 6